MLHADVLSCQMCAFASAHIFWRRCFSSDPRHFLSFSLLLCHFTANSCARSILYSFLLRIARLPLPALRLSSRSSCLMRINSRSNAVLFMRAVVSLECHWLAIKRMLSHSTYRERKRTKEKRGEREREIRNRKYMPK